MIKLSFVLGNALTSRMIAWFSSGHFSHVDAVLPDGRLLGARSDKADGVSGVRIRRVGYEKWERQVVFTIPSTLEQSQKFYDFLSGEVGKPYDHTAIWGFMFNRAWRDTDAWYCSELVMHGLEVAGVIDKLYLAANKITPVAAALVCSAIKGTWE